MKKICPKCSLANFGNAAVCARCQNDLSQIQVSAKAEKKSFKAKLLKRFAVLVAMIIFCVFGFYLTLILSAKRLTFTEKQKVSAAISVLDEKGFSKETFLLNYLTAFRSNDNWLNASVDKETAYAATNFPFEIMTLYPLFFSENLNDTERAAILLHEAQHLKGADEKEAYEFVWKNRRRLGWTKEKYGETVIWRNVGKLTKEYTPHLFNCPANPEADCTE